MEWHGWGEKTDIDRLMLRRLIGDLERVRR